MKNFILFTFMLLSSLTARSQTWYEATVKGANATIKTSMNTEAETVKVVLKGETFFCTKINGGWWPVYASQGGKRLGYMEASCIEILRESEANEEYTEGPVGFDMWCGTYTCSGTNYSYTITLHEASDGSYTGSLRKTLNGEKTTSDVKAVEQDNVLVITEKGKEDDPDCKLTLSFDSGMYQIQFPFLDYLVSIYKVQ